MCTVTHQEWLVVIYAPCTKSVHESVHDGTPNTGSILLRSQYIRVMIIAAPSSALMQKELICVQCVGTTQKVHVSDCMYWRSDRRDNGSVHSFVVRSAHDYIYVCTCIYICVCVPRIV